MDKSSCIELLKRPELLRSTSTEDLKEAIKSYPYFNNLQILAAKKARMENTENQADLLFSAALSTASRVRLHFFMESDLVELDEVEKEVDNEISAELVESLKAKPKPTFELPKQEYKSTPEEMGEQILEHTDIEGAKEDESHSFTGWLSKLGKGDVEEETSEDNGETEVLDEVDEMIQAHAYEAQLIKSASQIENINEEVSSEKEDNTEVDMDELAKKSASLQMGNVTETLAGIFELQKKYTKAIEAYEFLSLKYPEKSSFFASKIKNLKSKL